MIVTGNAAISTTDWLCFLSMALTLVLQLNDFKHRTIFANLCLTPIYTSCLPSSQSNLLVKTKQPMTVKNKPTVHLRKVVRTTVGCQQLYCEFACT